MSILQVNLGDNENDGTGDDLRTAFEKANANFSELDLTRVIFADNLGTGAQIFRNKIGNNLQFRSIKSSNLNTTVSSNDTEILIAVKDSINSVEEDTTPELGGNLDLNNNNIIGTGNITITGDISATQITGILNGPFIGNLTGNVLGNLTGDVTGDVTGSLFGNVLGNLTGDITGNVLGNLTGNVLGDVTGQVSSISNLVLSDLGNVSSTSPSAGQFLSWTGSVWAPETVTIPPAGVTRIIAGNNISISPSSGIGDVTISASSSGNITDINTFDLGNFRRIFTNPIVYLLDQVGIDFGTFNEPADFTVDLGTL